MSVLWWQGKCGLDDFNNKYLVMCKCGVMMGISLEIGVEIINGWTAEFESVELAVENWNRRAEMARCENCYHTCLKTPSRMRCNQF